MSFIQLRTQKPNLVLEELQDSYRKQSLSDVTLVCDEQGKFVAHKIILTISSPIFRLLLPDNSDHQYVYLQGVKATVLENLLQFMYQGETFIDNDEITDFLTAARDFQLREFTEEKTPDSLYVDPSYSVQDVKDVKLFSASDSVSETLDQYLQDSESLETRVKTERRKRRRNKIKTEKQNIPKREKVIVSSQEKKEILKQMVEKKQRRVKLDPVSGELVPQKFKCKICDASYYSSVGLSFHKKAKHGGAVYPCSECGYSSSFQPNTRRHFREKHQGKIYSCDKCDYKIGRSGLLKTHIDYEHFGVRYSCQYCSYEGKEQGKLNRHVRMVHLQLKS